MYSEDKRPLVSVVMPAYNAEKFISEAINSVLKQTYSVFELLIVDDCSSDSTAKIVNGFTDSRIVYLKNEKNSGPAFSRNRGIEAAAGDYIAFLDSDDVWHKDKIERQLALAERTDADIVYCSYSLIDSTGEKTRADFIVPETTDFEAMLKESVMSCSTVVIKSELMKKFRFRNGFYHEDYVLWLELLKAGGLAVGDSKVLADYRLLENSRSRDKLNSAKQRWIVYRKALSLDLFDSCRAFASYALNGIKKYCLR